MVWIRSQDKKSLVDAGVIILSPDHDASNDNATKLMAGGVVVGYFWNIAGAMRELDELAEWLDSQGSYTIETLFDPLEERKIVAGNVYQVKKET